MANGPLRGDIEYGVVVNGTFIGSWANIYAYGHQLSADRTYTEIRVDESFIRNGTTWYFDHWEFSGAVPPGLNANTRVQTSGIYGSPYGRLVAHAVFTNNDPHSDSAIDLRLICVPPNVGSLIGGGLTKGAVGTSTTYTVIAELLAAMKGRYRFAYWIDDQNVKHNEKSFSKTFTFKTGYTPQNPEVITFTAYFVACTGLILRSSSSGLILRGKANKILRDE